MGDPLMATFSFQLFAAASFDTIDRCVRSGIPAREVRALIDARQLDAGHLYRLVLPARTFSHRLARGECLAPAEADALVRLIRIRELARSTFGDADTGDRWLERPSRSFDGKAPIDLLDTESGGRCVEDQLLRIAHGQLA
jgi:putative toxin-antitoxin system antitoxin component (TIGR02293 family)